VVIVSSFGAIVDIIVPAIRFCGARISKWELDMVSLASKRLANALASSIAVNEAGAGYGVW
jgi:hypothetical protein